MTDNQTRPEKRLGPKVVPITDLLPHPLNANIMSEDLRAKLAAHISQSGRYPMVIVRPAPEAPGKFQILDGHHRVQVLRDLGHTEVRCDAWDVTDREAKVLLATLNRLQGADQPIRRAQLIHELLGEMSLEDLAGLLPESDKQLEESRLLEFPAEEIAALLAEDAEQQEKTLPQVLTFVVSQAQAEVIERAVELASDGTPGRDRKAKGLANLAAKFLAGEAA